MSENRSSGGLFGVGAALFGLAFVILPIMFSSNITAVAQIILMAFGVVLLLIGTIVLTITKLYRRTSANEAFVRTGMGGEKVIINGGALVIPVIHNVVPVSLETMKLEVRRTETGALITGDSLRVDVVSEFYIKVNKEMADVIAAATSLGGRSVNPSTVKELVEEKFVSALRTVAATMELNDLHTKRDDFASAVEAIVKKDLQPNGLTLETVTISSLDQTSMAQMRAEDNVFDAKGARKVAEIVENQRVETTKIRTAADRDVKQQEVARDKFIYQQEVERAEADAKKRSDIERANAKSTQEAATYAAEQQQLSETAAVKKDEAVQLAEVAKQQNLEVANQKKDQAAQEAEIAKNQAVEVADQEREIAVANKRKEKAEADTKTLEAQSAEETARQKVKTVEVVESAKRDKEKTVIAEQASAEASRVRENVKADVKAYEITKQAEAEKEAAENAAEAVRVEAKASKDAKIAKAEGDRAEQMVPVEVERSRVEVRAADVEVTGTELKYKSEHAEISKELEIALAEVQAKKEIGIAQAQSLGAALAQADMQIWGDNDMLTKITSMFGNGQAAAGLVNGFMAQVDESTSSSIFGAFRTVLDKVGIKLTKPQEAALETAEAAAAEETAAE